MLKLVAEIDRLTDWKATFVAPDLNTVQPARVSLHSSMLVLAQNL